MRHRESPQVVAGRVERLAAERRRVQRALDGHTRTRRRADGTVWRVETSEPAAGTARDRLLVRAAHLDEQIGHWTGVREAYRAAGRIDAVDWDQVRRPGDLLEYRGRWEVVRRANLTTVTVVVDPGWQDKILKRGAPSRTVPHRHRPVARGRRRGSDVVRRPGAPVVHGRRPKPAHRKTVAAACGQRPDARGRAVVAQPIGPDANEVGCFGSRGVRC